MKPRATDDALLKNITSAVLRILTCGITLSLIGAPAVAQEQAVTAPEKARDEKAKDATPKQDVELETVVIRAVIGTYHESASSMASKIPMDVRDLASSLSIMNQAAIRDRNAVALTDVFNYVVGATQSQGNINGFSFRGFTNIGSYTQNIQFDGLMGATLKKASTSAANVESLEFLKGPNGVLYGQMNPGGLLNIVTKSPQDVQHANLRLSLGQYAGAFRSGAGNTASLAVDTTGPIMGSDKLSYRLVIDGGKSPPSRLGSNAHSISFYPSLTYRWSDDTSLTLKGEDSQDRRRQDDGVIPIFDNPATINVPLNIGGVTTQVATAAYGPAATWHTAPLDTLYQNSTDWARDYGSAFSTFFRSKLGAWNLRAQSRYVWHVDEVDEFTVNNGNVYSPVLSANARYATPTTFIRRQYNFVKNGHRYNFGDVNVYRTFGPEKFQHTILIGVNGGAEGFFNNRIAFGPNTTAAQAITLLNPVLDLYAFPTTGIIGAQNQLTWQTTFGQYLADQIKVGELLNISLGIRHDNLKSHGYNATNPQPNNTFYKEITPTTGQAGIVYHVIPAVSLYGSWSQSVKPQTTISYDIDGNQDFPPEKGEQVEVGAKLQTADKNVNLTLATYQITRTNVVVATGLNFSVPTGSAVIGSPISRLDGKQQSKGYEAELQWQPKPNWQLQLGWAHSNAIIKESAANPQTIGLNLVNAPTNTGNFWTRYNIPHGTFAGLGFGAGVIYVGDAWAGDPTTALYYPLPAWTRVDASAYYKWDRYDLALNIQNALDKRYIASAQSALTLNVGEQRKMTLSLGVKF